MLRSSVGGRRRILLSTGLMAGALGGGLLLGALIVIIESILAAGASWAPRWIVIIVSTASIVALIVPSRLRLPTVARQVRPDTLVRRSTLGAGAIWGMQLGTGFSTYIVTPAWYALVVVAAILTPVATCLVLGFYSLFRVGVVVAVGYVGRPTPRVTTPTSFPGSVSRTDWISVPIILAAIIAVVLIPVR